MQDLIKQLIQKCIKGERSSQKELYVNFSPKMFVVCLRYSKNREDAEETLQEGFIKVFDNLSQFNFSGSFEGWIRKIMINCALQRYRSKSHLRAVINIEDISVENTEWDNNSIYSRLDTKDLVKLVQQLSPGYRMIFNLYVFEKMKHREIAVHLGISEGTSKSNLSDAKAILQKAILHNEKIAKTYSLKA